MSRKYTEKYYKRTISELEAQVATLHDNLTQTEATLAGVVEDAKRYKAELAEWHNSCSTEIAAHLKTEDDLERYMLALDLAVENIDPYIVVCAAESGNDVVNAYLNKADAILKEQKDANVRTV
jgi:septal ring factor EnvC (AmiA/AmiB activator)